MQKRKILFAILVLSLMILFGSVYHFRQDDRDNTENLDYDVVSEEDRSEKDDILKSETVSETEDTSRLEDTSQFEETVQKEEPVVVEDDVFVKVQTYIPDIQIELKYAGTDNFTGQKIYDFTDAYLRYGTVKKLMQVQESLREEGLSLKIWDAFRPTAAQFKLWEVYPDAAYVANPNNGFSSHSRGNTIDITLVNKNGKEIIMPTQFDDFSKLADRDYSDCSEEARKNALLLENLMKENGFKAYSGEWWHFTDVDTYSVEENFQP